MPEEAYLKPENIKVRQLVNDYRTGRVVIPEFQRDYVWKPSKAPKLIDSLYRDFPIASLLLWQSADSARARRANGRGPYGPSTNWLIDGQQRVITLARALSIDEDLDVVFNTQTDEFRLANAATRKDPNWVSVAVLCDDESYRALRRDLGEGRAAQQSEARFEKVRRILDYEVPVVRMINHTFEQAVQAFTRINTLGVRLKKEDIDSARVAARHSGFIAEEVVPYLEKLRRGGFSRLNIMHLFRACAVHRSPRWEEPDAPARALREGGDTRLEGGPTGDRPGARACSWRTRARQHGHTLVRGATRTADRALRQYPSD